MMPVKVFALILGLQLLGLASATAGEDHFRVTSLAPDLLMLSTDQGSYSTNSLVLSTR